MEYETYDNYLLYCFQYFEISVMAGAFSAVLYFKDNVNYSQL